MSTEIFTPQLWTDLAVIAGAALGNFARTMVPYWAKLREMPELVFERKFLGTAIISFIGALGLGLGLFPTFAASVGDSGLSLAAVFATVALSAFGLNAGINWGIDQVTAVGGSSAAKAKDQPSAP
jgi:hypothetical protein